MVDIMSQTANADCLITDEAALEMMMLMLSPRPLTRIV